MHRIESMSMWRMAELIYWVTSPRKCCLAVAAAQILRKTAKSPWSAKNKCGVKSIFWSEKTLTRHKWISIAIDSKYKKRASAIIVPVGSCNRSKDSPSNVAQYCRSSLGAVQISISIMAQLTYFYSHGKAARHNRPIRRLNWFVTSHFKVSYHCHPTLLSYVFWWLRISCFLPLSFHRMKNSLYMQRYELTSLAMGSVRVKCSITRGPSSPRKVFITSTRVVVEVKEPSWNSPSFW